MDYQDIRDILTEHFKALYTLENHPFFARAYESGAKPEQAVFTCCQFLLESESRPDGGASERHKITATAFGYGVIRFMPDSPIAEQFKELLKIA